MNKPEGSVLFVGPLPTYRYRFASPASNPMGSCVSQRPMMGSNMASPSVHHVNDDARRDLLRAIAGRARPWSTKITAAANGVFGSWRENDHDDLVLAVRSHVGTQSASQRGEPTRLES